MKIKKKLRDLTKEEWQNNKEQTCGKYYDCYGCPFASVACSDYDISSWINNKDLFSDKFLNQEVEIEVPDILTKEEKKYLSAVMKPFKDDVKYIARCGSTKEKQEYEYILAVISSKHTPDNYMCLPYFKKGLMYKGMELDKEYTLKDLGLFKEQKPESTSVSAKKKITLTEFWESEEKLAIHCNAVEEKADKLLEAFDKLDKIWRSGESYLENNNWDKYTEETCYDNSGRFGSYNCYKEKNYTIYEFEDVDLDN